VKEKLKMRKKAISFAEREKCALAKDKNVVGPFFCCFCFP
jgi:hypothetical protein